MQASPSLDRTSATLPAVPLMLTEPTLSGWGSAPLGVVPAASCTRWYWPGAMLPEREALLAAKFPVPAALVYCTDQPSRDTGAPLRLNSST